MASTKFARFSIDSTLELTADHFEAYEPGTTRFRNATRDDRVTLNAGLIPIGGSARLVTAIDNGLIDEYELQFDPVSVRSTIRGRDPAAKLLDKYFRKRYRREPIPPTVEAATPTSPGPATIFPTSPPDGVISVPGCTEIPVTEEVTGRFMAKQIATEIVEFCGLKLSWEVRDYELQEDFEAVGRASELLARLVEPWTIVEPFRADTFLRGGTVIVRHRSLPDKPFVVDSKNVFTMREARRAGLSVRKRAGRKIGRVTLRGRKTASTLRSNLDANGNIIGVEHQKQGPGGAIVGTEIETVDTRRTFDEFLNPVALVITTTRIRMPDNIQLKRKVETYTYQEQQFGGLRFSATLTKRDTIIDTYDASIYDDRGPVNKPLRRSSTSLSDAIDPEDNVFKTIKISRVGYAYDELNFLRQESTIVYELQDDPRTAGGIARVLIGRTSTGAKITAPGVTLSGTFAKVFSPTGMTVKSTFTVSPLVQEQVTDVYTRNVDDPNNTFWQLQRRESQTSGGHPAAGPGRAQPTQSGAFTITVPNSGTSNAAANQGLVTLTIDCILSPDPDAVPVSYSNPHLSQDDLDFLFSLLQAATNIFEYEFSFNGVAMPWLVRGVVIQFVQLTVEDGTTISLPPALVTSVRTTYDESKQAAEHMQMIRAFAWRTVGTGP